MWISLSFFSTSTLAVKKRRKRRKFFQASEIGGAIFIGIRVDDIRLRILDDRLGDGCIRIFLDDRLGDGCIRIFFDDRLEISGGLFAEVTSSL